MVGSVVNGVLFYLETCAEHITVNEQNVPGNKWVTRTTSPPLVCDDGETHRRQKFEAACPCACILGVCKELLISDI